MHVTEQEQQQINELVVEAEGKSGAQVLIVIIAKADAYPEIPWKAFALGTALAALALTIDVFYGPDWLRGFEAAVILGAGAVLALLTIFAPPFARLFLGRLRVEAEVLQYAQAAFVERGVSRTRGGIGVLLLIALFEREVVILPDRGITRHITAAEVEALMAQMKPFLAQRRLVSACETGLSALGALLAGKLLPQGAGNELPDAVVQERGA